MNDLVSGVCVIVIANVFFLLVCAVFVLLKVVLM